MHDQQYLNNYFANHWQSRLDEYEFSGWALTKKIRLGESVLDVGCGTNPFKGYIANLTGIDPAFKQADYRCTLEEFEPNIRFDVAFCLGSINFGTEETILHQIQCLTNLLTAKARIYWRCNPGLQDHNNEQCKQIVFFPWTEQKLGDYAAMFDFRLADLQHDTNNRLYAEWTRA